MANNYEIDIRGQDQSKAAFNRVKKSITDVEKGLKQTASSGKSAAGIFKGMTLSRVFVDSLYKALSYVKQLAAMGIKYNATIETSRLGIASILASQSQIVTQEGKVLKGRDALNAALKVSTDLVKSLEIRGLQTTATMEQLVGAMQESVGPAMSMGLNLKETEGVVLDIVQAAGALGVPMYQINEEVRSILSGTINMHSRVGKALGLTNEMVKNWAQMGKLGQELTKRLETFRTAGVETAKTWAGLVSNTEEMAAKLSGTLTRSIFDDIKNAMQGVQESVIQVNDEGVQLAPWVQDAKEYVDRLWNLFKDLLSTVWNLGGKGALGAVAGIADVILATTEKIVKGWKLIADSYVGSMVSEALEGIGEGWSHIAGLIREGADYLDKIDPATGKVIKRTEDLKTTVKSAAEQYELLSGATDTLTERFQKTYLKAHQYLEKELAEFKKVEREKTELVQKATDLRIAQSDRELAHKRQMTDFKEQEKQLKRELRVLKGYAQPLTEEEQKKQKIKSITEQLKRLGEDRAIAERDHASETKKTAEELAKLETKGKDLETTYKSLQASITLVKDAINQSSQGSLQFNENLTKGVSTAYDLAQNLITAGKAITAYNESAGKLSGEAADKLKIDFSKLEADLQKPIKEAAEASKKVEEKLQATNQELPKINRELTEKERTWKRINELADAHEQKVRRISQAIQDWGFKMDGVTDQMGDYSPAY